MKVKMLTDKQMMAQLNMRAGDINETIGNLEEELQCAISSREGIHAAIEVWQGRVSITKITLDDIPDAGDADIEVVEEKNGLPTTSQIHGWAKGYLTRALETRNQKSKSHKQLVASLYHKAHRAGFSNSLVGFDNKIWDALDGSPKFSVRGEKWKLINK